MDSTELINKFNIGDAVVYPTQGVGYVLNTEMRREREYLRIHITALQMDVLLPSDNAESLGLRHLATKKEAEAAISSLSKTLHYNTSLDWKSRLEENQDLVKEGSLKNVADVVNILYKRSKQKELPALERKLYESALSMLVDESSSVLGLSVEETKKRIFSRLEPICKEYPHLE